MRYTYIFWDLDGTITDSCPGIINSVSYALNHFGISLPREQLLPFIGPPLRDSFGPLLQSPEKVDKAIEKYREYYTDRGIFENSVYAGVRELLADCCQAGAKLCLATSKPEPFALRIMEHFALSPYFSCVAGAQLHGPRQHKPAVLAYACRELAVRDLAACVMLGDRKYDVEGAHAVGMDCAAVLYGYGSRQELEDAGADYICPTVADVRRLLLA